jgi:hypothetical protein
LAVQFWTAQTLLTQFCPQQSVSAVHAVPFCLQPVAAHVLLTQVLEQHATRSEQAWPSAVHVAGAPHLPALHAPEQHCALCVHPWPSVVQTTAAHLPPAHDPEQHCWATTHCPPLAPQP